MDTSFETLEAEKFSLLRRMARVRLPKFQIAFAIGITLDTLDIYYGDLIEEAKVGIDLHVLETLAQLACSGKSVGATTFWARSKCGWTMPTAASQQFDSWREGPPPPGSVVVIGPNGERK